MGVVLLGTGGATFVISCIFFLGAQLDLPNTTKISDTYTYLNEDSKLITVNLVSGEVTGIQDQPVIRESYTLSKGDVLCDLMLEEGSYGSICRIFGIKLGTLNYWRHRHPDFEERLTSARKARADYHFERAVFLAEDEREHGGKESLPSTKLAIDTHKWAAEKMNQDKYGNRTKITGDPTSPVTFVIDTGIRRDAPAELPVEESRPIPVDDADCVEIKEDQMSFLEDDNSEHMKLGETNEGSKEKEQQTSGVVHEQGYPFEPKSKENSSGDGEEKIVGQTDKNRDGLHAASASADNTPGSEEI